MQRNRTRSVGASNESLATKATHFASEVSRKAGEISREVVKDTAQVERAVSGWIKERPLQAVLLAVGAGLFLGRFRARVVDTTLLAVAAGFGCGFALTRTARSRGGRAR